MLELLVGIEASQSFAANQAARRPVGLFEGVCFRGCLRELLAASQLCVSSRLTVRSIGSDWLGFDGFRLARVKKMGPSRFCWKLFSFNKTRRCKLSGGCPLNLLSAIFQSLYLSLNGFRLLAGFKAPVTPARAGWLPSAAEQSSAARYQFSVVGRQHLFSLRRLAHQSLKFI